MSDKELSKLHQYLKVMHGDEIIVKDLPVECDTSICGSVLEFRGKEYIGAKVSDNYNSIIKSLGDEFLKKYHSLEQVSLLVPADYIRYIKGTFVRARIDEGYYTDVILAPGDVLTIMAKRTVTDEHKAILDKLLEHIREELSKTPNLVDVSEEIRSVYVQ